MKARCMRFARFSFLAALLSLCIAAGCSEPPAEPVRLKSFSLDSADSIIDTELVRVESDNACEGGACLRVETSGPRKIRLFMLDDVNVDDASLVFQAKVRSQGLAGTAYLEMWCIFEGQGEYFARALDTAARGDTEWILQTAPFRLESGQNPDQVLLNLVIEGPGTVWIDNAALYRAPLL
ncbi:MAG: hypothetical protein ACOCWR_10695 [Oceanidesulfovibrio sp.]